LNATGQTTTPAKKTQVVCERSPLLVKQCVKCGTLRVLENEPAECPTCAKYHIKTTDVRPIIMLPTSHDRPKDYKLSYGITGEYLA